MKKALKRSLSFLLAITIIFGSAYVGLSEVDFCGLFAIKSQAASASDLHFSLSEDGKTYFVSGCSYSATGSLTIPSSYKGKAVTAIGAYAFNNCDGITSVTIPNSVTIIKDAAFGDCDGLTSIRIPGSVTDIGNHAFYSCDGLTSITFPDSVKSIGYWAFMDCSKISYIKIPDTVTYIGEGSFSGTAYYNNPSNWVEGDLYIGKHLIEVDMDVVGNYVVKNDTKSIAGGAFDSCHDLTAITIPNSVVGIGAGAFYRCFNLASVKIPDSVTVIGEEAFYECTSLTSISIPNKVTSIFPRTFRRCVSLTSVSIGNGVKSIGEEAFQDCNAITSITFGNSVTSVGKYAFWGCDDLQNVIYAGDKTQWSKIEIAEGNESLLNANKKFRISTPKVSTTNEIGGVQVTWNKVSGATKYVVFRRQGGYNTWVNVGTTTGNTLLDKNVKSGIFYVYSVRAYNSAGQYSDFVTANTQTRKYMATPKLTTIYNHVNGLAIKWNAVAGITKGYRVYRRGAGSTYWTYLGTTKNLYFIDSQVKNKSGEYFRYTVIADGGYHSKFDTTGLYLRRLANPTLTSAVSSSAGITVKWGAVKGTTGYYVYRKTANSTWTRVGTVGGTNNTTFLDKTAKKGTTYTYTVKAVYGATTSAYYSGISCKDKY